MSRPNRVLPTGEIVADPARGLFMGNRGRIHTDAGLLGPRRWQNVAWITCLLSFKGRRRPLMGAGYTELFFLDEAVALAAGHRPCAECRRDAFERFRKAWAVAFEMHPRAPEMDKRLHADRLDVATGNPCRHRAPLAALPDGCFVLAPGDGQPCLVLGESLLPFYPQGYGAARPRSGDTDLEVLTPRSTVAVLRAGYVPEFHPSAEAAG